MRASFLSVMLFALWAVYGISAAQSYPSKPIRFIVPFPAAGPSDTLARTIGQNIGEAWEQRVIVENRPGANSIIGAELAARAAPDGYTIVIVTVAHYLNASLYKKLSFDPIKDFDTVSLIAAAPFILVAHPSVPVRSVKELIGLAKARPRELAYSSTGGGSTPHLSGELFSAMAGVQMLHVPYKGNTPATTAVLSGEVSIMFNNVLAATPPIKAGRLRALAVSSAKRIGAMPELPTIAESGLAGFDTGTWFGVLVPAGTSKPVIEKLGGEIVRTVRSPEIIMRFTKQGVELLGSTPEEFTAYIRAETAKWARVIKSTGIKTD